MKRKIKEKANLIQLTFSALNKSGLIFACFLLGGLVFAGVSFWRTLQEVDSKSCNNIAKDVEPPLSLDPLSEKKAMSESYYDTYRNIAFKTFRKSLMSEMIYEKRNKKHSYNAMVAFDGRYGEALDAQSTEGLDYILKSEFYDFELLGWQKEDYWDLLLTNNSSDELREKLDLYEYQKDYKYLRKKNY